uniref:aldehyde dehydrogenase family protein n=1 Tax=Pseudomonas sp. TaxID=306 RepID=UPI0025891175
MTALNTFYINGQWVAPHGQNTMPIINPATELHIGEVALGDAEDAVQAIMAARRAFSSFSRTTREERIGYLEKVLQCYMARYEEMAQAVSQELGAPLTFAREAQVATGQIHLETTIEALKTYVFDEQRDDVLVTREAIGVCSLITPWNWPLNQIVCKVAPALAAGCCM